MRGFKAPVASTCNTSCWKQGQWQIGQRNARPVGGHLALRRAAISRSCCCSWRRQEGGPRPLERMHPALLAAERLLRLGGSQGSCKLLPVAQNRPHCPAWHASLPGHSQPARHPAPAGSTPGGRLGRPRAPVQARPAAPEPAGQMLGSPPPPEACEAPGRKGTDLQV